MYMICATSGMDIIHDRANMQISTWESENANADLQYGDDENAGGENLSG